MSNRNAKSSKAIRQFWNNERNLVLRGEGTRQWDQKQQEAILDGGRPKDENGYSFHGHHMKSVSMYPEYQGDPNNIQALSKEEHLLAHSNCTQNATNGRFDYKTGVTHDFGDNPPTPCPIIKLNNPIVYSNNAVSIDQKNNVDSLNVKFKPSNENTEKNIGSINNRNYNNNNIKKESNISTGLTHLKQFYLNNKSEINTLLGTVAIDLIYQAASSKQRKPKSTKTVLPKNNVLNKTHSSPTLHNVKPHTQAYHTKNGIIIKNKSSYRRGGK